MFRKVLRRLHILRDGRAKVIYEFFNFSLRSHRNVSSEREPLLGVLRNGRPLNSKVLLTTVLSVKEILRM
jgi:hypothetical protein